MIAVLQTEQGFLSCSHKEQEPHQASTENVKNKYFLMTKVALFYWLKQ